MSLFSQRLDPPINILPSQGQANYHGVVLGLAEADYYFEHFLTHIKWQHDQAIVFDKKITTKRQVAWYGSQAFAYTYSKITRSALPFTPQLLELKKVIETITGETYNSCLLNLYQSGDEGMSWHSDNEHQLKRHGAIASISLGAERSFAFKHKTSHQTHSAMLEHGSLLVMQGETQSHWLHRLAPTKKITTPRVNLTFRTIVER